jgi:hypothetical protein
MGDQSITVGSWFVPRRQDVARRYEQAHGGPARYRVEAISDGPLPMVSLLRHTGPVSSGRYRHVREFRLADEFASEPSDAT